MMAAVAPANVELPFPISKKTPSPENSEDRKIGTHTTEDGVQRQEIAADGPYDHGCGEAEKFVDNMAATVSCMAHI